ncbi:MAG: 2-oxo acid dehydrogenase subunit E2 [Bacteroidales bacterium]|jgi:pyruvate/2-oxoglutarate dehydrogenase complex dihydrolipoamide acyltransferase (E2) component|nr:2-oxo acid dehydrogenase subunit E2 [Bacteroidales bacterium]
MSKSEFNSDWRKVAAAIYKKPSDAKILGTAEVDVTELEAYVSKKRKEGLKITLTHIFTLIVARGLNEAVPELNCYVKRGNIVKRDQIDAMVSVLLPDGEMSSVKVENADKLNLEEVAIILSGGIKESRAGDENRTMKMKGVMGKIPWPFRTWIFNLIKFLTIKWGIAIPKAGLDTKNFGSFVMTNIGSIGLDTGFPALFPISNVSFVFVMGGVTKKPVVINDEIVIRRMMTISSALDHRIVDAMHGGKMFKYIKRMIQEPEVLEESTWST